MKLEALVPAVERKIPVIVFARTVAQIRAALAWAKDNNLKIVALAEIKAKPVFKDFPLVRISRLSVMPVSQKEWAEIEKMAGAKPSS